MSEELAIPAIAPRNPGWFKPGGNPNPGGRPKSAKIISDELRKLLDKGNGKKIAQQLITLSLEASQPAVRVKASEIILDRIEGKPLQAIQVSQTLDENTARRLVEIGAMLQHILPANVVSELTHPVINAELAEKTHNCVDIDTPEKTLCETKTKRKYVRSGKYAKANKGRKSIRYCAHGLVEGEICNACMLTTQSTDPTDQSVTKPSVSD